MKENVIMGNRSVDVLSRGLDDLRRALELLSNGLELSSVMEVGGHQLVLFWAHHPGARELLVPLRCGQETADYVWTWLERRALPTGKYDGGDTLDEKGAFRAWCGPWGRDEEFSLAFGRVEARYAWIGK